ncbi:MAG: helix-turn-helix domain-containing protein [Gammaproteobacteria bacterium]|nr:helix-turn-helix domain-containing protein [Gammaproteobacteria bacterium]
MHFSQSCNSRRRQALPGNLTDENLYKMMMLFKYQHKSCAQLARQFGITRAQAYDLIARRQVGGCSG